MAADTAELYIVIAPIAAAFAGFGGLASGIHQRRGRDDARVDAFRLATMLFSSLSATLLGLLPATLEGLLLADRAAVRVCAFVALVGIAVYVPIGVGRARKIRNVTGFSKSGGLANSACLLTAFAAFTLCAAGVWADRVPGLYLLGLVGLLSSSAVMFWRVIASMLRPAHAS
jgi:hypothetical protein